MVASNSTNTALLGTYTLSDGTLSFQPKYPFVPGVGYQILFKDGTEETNAEFRLPKPQHEPAKVTNLFPSSDQLAENTLRFYIHFSRPMARGEIYKHIKLTNDTDKKTVELPFLELEEELWSNDQTRVTLLIDPGRIKREVKPRVDLGPVLEAGKTFTLHVSKKWKDAEGTPLAKDYQKTYSVSKPIREPIDPDLWKLQIPSKGSRESIKVTFTRSLDSALAQRLIWVNDTDGQKLEGTIALDKNERIWLFTPKKEWKVGRHQLFIANHLEDPSGNRVGEPFEVDLLKPVGVAAREDTTKLAFVIK